MKKDQGITNEKLADIRAALKGEAISFGDWIAEKLSKDSWFAYHPEFNKWFIHMTGHITTEQLYKKYMLERSQIAQKNEFVIPDVSASVCDHDFTHFIEKDSVCSKCGFVDIGSHEQTVR